MNYPVGSVKSDVEKWFEDQGYNPNNVFIVDEVYIDLSCPIEDEDILKFNEDFKTELLIDRVSYTSKRGVKRYVYKFNHISIDEFASSMDKWFKKNKVPFKFFLLSRNINIISADEFSVSSILDFEKEFNVKYQGFEIDCIRKVKNYLFH